jgi:hypothetical protein
MICSIQRIQGVTLLPGLTPDKALLWDKGYFSVCTAVYLIAGVAGLILATRGGEKLRRAAPGLAILVFLCGLAYHFPYTNDDSFIFFRYADNIAAGHGPVYNLGERCEGFTSPVWLAILTGARLIGCDLLLAAKLAGALLGLLTVLLILASCRQLTTDSMSLYLSAFMLASSALFQSWICSGMDVALFLFWESLAVFVFTRERTPEILLWGVTAIAGWVRPEANMVIIVAWAWRLWMTRTTATRHTILLRMAGIIGLLAIPFVARYAVYGQLLPTTFYAKSDRTLRSGIGFLFGAAHGLGPLLWILALAGLWRLWRRQGWLLFVTGTYAAYFALVGGDILTQRFSLFWIPFLWMGLAQGLSDASQLLSKRRLAVAVALLLIVSGQELHRMYQVTRAGPGWEGYLYVSSSSIGTSETDAEIGHYLSEHATPDQQLVTDNIGAIGYYSKLRILDVNGLTDKNVAELIHQGRHNQILDYVRRVDPEWIVCYPGPDSIPGSCQLVSAGVLTGWTTGSYQPAGVWRSRTGYTRVLFRRNDVPIN